MKHKTTASFAGLATAVIIILFSCSKTNNNDNTNPPGNTGDSALVNIGTNLILVSYQDLAVKTAAMDAAVTAFVQAPDATKLSSAQAAFKSAYLSWETCSGYEFGPAADQSLATNTINVFPTDTAIIKTNISSGSYTIDGIGNLKAQGFPALDFLLFSTDNNAVLSRFTTDAAATNAKKYLSAVAASLKTKSAATLAAWTGGYITTFKNATGVNAGSSLSLLVNAFVYDFDVVLKTYKLGVPFGKFGATAVPQAPAKVEAWYSRISLQLMIQQVKALQAIYLGGTGYGFDDKVIASKAQKNAVALNDVITAQFNTLLAKLNALSDPLAAAIVNNNAAVSDAYTEAGKLVVLLKVDLSSALGIKISFQDDDGD
jgi:predicted lipoprotein